MAVLRNRHIITELSTLRLVSKQRLVSGDYRVASCEVYYNMTISDSMIGAST